MQLRRLTPDDAPAYRALRLRAFREHAEAFTSSFEESEGAPLSALVKRLTSEDCRFWGAFDNGELCAMVGLERETRIKNRHKATLIGMYVAPEQNGRGLGRALVDEVLREAKSAGIEMLVLTVTEGNSRAAQLYERAGFRSFGVEPRDIKVEGR